MSWLRRLMGRPPDDDREQEKAARDRALARAQARLERQARELAALDELMRSMGQRR